MVSFAYLAIGLLQFLITPIQSCQFGVDRLIEDDAFLSHLFIGDVREHQEEYDKVVEALSESGDLQMFADERVIMRLPALITQSYSLPDGDREFIHNHDASTRRQKVIEKIVNQMSIHALCHCVFLPSSNIKTIMADQIQSLKLRDPTVIWNLVKLQGERHCDLYTTVPSLLQTAFDNIDDDGLMNVAKEIEQMANTNQSRLVSSAQKDFIFMRAMPLSIYCRVYEKSKKSKHVRDLLTRTHLICCLISIDDMFEHIKPIFHNEDEFRTYIVCLFKTNSNWIDTFEGDKWHVLDLFREHNLVKEYLDGLGIEKRTFLDAEYLAACLECVEDALERTKYEIFFSGPDITATANVVFTFAGRIELPGLPIELGLPIESCPVGLNPATRCCPLIQKSLCNPKTFLRLLWHEKAMKDFCKFDSFGYLTAGDIANVRLFLEMAEMKREYSPFTVPVSIINKKQLHILHLLVFDLGPFGEGLDSDYKKLLMSFAKAMYPIALAQLQAAKLSIANMNIETLYNCPYIDKRWLKEYYGSHLVPWKIHDA